MKYEKLGVAVGVIVGVEVIVGVLVGVGVGSGVSVGAGVDVVVGCAVCVSAKAAWIFASDGEQLTKKKKTRTRIYNFFTVSSQVD